MTGITSVGDGFFHRVTKEVLARKLTFEAGPEGEGYGVQMSWGEVAQGEGRAAAAACLVLAEQQGPVRLEQ